MFRSLDPSNRGAISLAQYHTAMRNLFITNYNKEPKGFIESRISMETFLEERCVASAGVYDGSHAPLQRSAPTVCVDQRNARWF